MFRKGRLSGQSAPGSRSAIGEQQSPRLQRRLLLLDDEERSRESTASIRSRSDDRVRPQVAAASRALADQGRRGSLSSAADQPLRPRPPPSPDPVRSWDYGSWTSMVRAIPSASFCATLGDGFDAPVLVRSAASTACSTASPSADASRCSTPSRTISSPCTISLTFIRRCPTAAWPANSRKPRRRSSSPARQPTSTRRSGSAPESAMVAG